MKESLDREMGALLDAERERSGPPAATRRRVLARVEASAASLRLPRPARRTSPAAPTTRSVLRPIGIAVLVMGLGAALAVASRPRPVARTAEQAPTARASTSEQATLPPPVAPVPGPLPVTPDPPSTPRSIAPPKLEGPARSLPDEHTLLDRARKDLLSGEPEAALDEVERHARRFPHGMLSEERDALRVEALVAAKRYARARAAGGRFRTAYPGSMLGPAVDDALQAIP
ncbi:MAG: hypothetical protein FWD17_02995 [Polyangiaceae bacterium]|nr:hypothetical protein [Polyangiaceae bacterium]